jgi:hypothetical protein
MKKLFKLPVRFLWVFAAIIILQACYPGDSIPITDLDTTTTLYNSDDLATAPTSAAIVWEVVQIEDDTEDDLPYDGEQDEAILNTTLQELVKIYGVSNVVIISENAVPVPTPSNSNVIVVIPTVDPIPSVNTIYAPSVVLRKQTIVYTYPGYPWWGGGGWWGGYPGYGGCYYCGYPSYGSASYQTGTVVLEMYDLRKIVGGVIPEDYDMSWIAAMKGLLSNNQTPSAATSRVISGIEKAFEQSPYLDPNK